MNLKDLKPGRYYLDANLGLIKLITSHPDDGACLIVEKITLRNNEPLIKYSESVYLKEVTLLEYIEHVHDIAVKDLINSKNTNLDCFLDGYIAALNGLRDFLKVFYE